MPLRPYSRGLSRFRREPVRGAAAKMGLPWDAYYVLTKAEPRLTNSKVHPNSGAPNYNIKHEFTDLISKSHTLLDDIGTNTHAQLDTHKTSDGSDHSFIDQDVTILSSPTFAGLTSTEDALFKKDLNFDNATSTTFTQSGIGQFNFDDDILMNNGEVIRFRSTAAGINSAAEGYLDYYANNAHRFHPTGANQDISMQFIGTTFSGEYQWNEDFNYFDFLDQIHCSKIPVGTAVSQGSLWVNPPSGSANNTLQGWSVGGSEKARLQVDGDFTSIGFGRFNGGLGVGADPGIGQQIRTLGVRDGSLVFRNENTSTTPGAQAQFLAKTNNVELSMVSHGSGRTIERWGMVLGSTGELLSNGGELGIGTIGSHDVFLGTETIRQIKIDGSTQELMLGLDDTNHVSIDAAGKVVYVGTAGVPFGEIYTNDNAVNTSVSSAGFTQVTIFTVDGVSSNMTPDHTNDYITITKAGHYMCNVCATVTNQAGAGHKIEMVVGKNNNASTFANMRRHRTLASGTDAGALPICGHIDLAVNDTIEVWVTSDSGAAKNIIIEDITLGLTMIGGT